MGRCRATTINVSCTELWRCTHEYMDGHTEHYYNFYRRLTQEEKNEIQKKIEEKTTKFEAVGENDKSL